MKLKLVLESVDDVSLSIIPNSKLELELSQSNIISSGGIPNTDFLPEGEINKYFTPYRVETIVTAMMPSNTDDLSEGVVNKYYSDQLAIEAISPYLENKLDKSEYVQHFRGVFKSYASLSNSIPVGIDGDYAHIDSGSGFDRMVAIWDTDDNKWIVNEVNIAQTTDEVTEGNNNLYFTSERVMKTPLSSVVDNNTPVVTNDLLLDAISKLQSQINYLKNNPPSPSPIPIVWYGLTSVSSSYSGLSDGVGYPTFAKLEFAKVNGFLYMRGGFGQTGTPSISINLRPEWKVRAVFGGYVNNKDMAPNLRSSSSTKPSGKMCVYSSGILLNEEQTKTVDQTIGTIEPLTQNINIWLDGAVCLGELIIK